MCGNYCKVMKKFIQKFICFLKVYIRNICKCKYIRIIFVNVDKDGYCIEFIDVYFDIWIKIFIRNK